MIENKQLSDMNEITKPNICTKKFRQYNCRDFYVCSVTELNIGI